MSDPAPGALSPQAEELLAFRLARKALLTMAAMLAPVLLVVSWLGYDKYTDLNAKYEESTDRLVQATRETEVRAEALKALADSLRLFLRSQTTELSYASTEAERMRIRQEAIYSQLTLRAADDRVHLLHSVNRAVDQVNDLSTTVRESAAEARTAAQFASQAKPELDRLAQAYESTRRSAQQALSIAEEASVQTVGARSRRHLYGTPFDVYFSGISRDALRNLAVSHRGGPPIRSTSRHPSNEVIEIPVGDTTYRISIVNLIDIPGGLLRLNGSSRADAATFRVTRSRTAPEGVRAPAGDRQD